MYRGKDAKGSGHSTQQNNMIRLQNISKTFVTDGVTFSALQDVTLRVEQGAFVGIIGRSGSGKSTLLNMMAGIDTPSTGEVRVDTVSIHSLKQSQLDAWRGKTIGLVFQFFQLIPTLTVVENVMLPMDLCKMIPAKVRPSRALDLLDMVGIADKAHKFPAVLSGGEKQRVALARAMANDPPVIFGDEPTGNLDSISAEMVFTLFDDLHKLGKTVVIVGVGGIGAEIGRLCLAFGMRVIGVRRRDLPPPHAGMEIATDLADVIAEADHLVLAARA